MSLGARFVGLALVAMIALAGSSVALAVNTESWESTRVAVAALSRATGDAAEARSAAIAGRSQLFEAMSMAGSKVADAQRIVDAGGPLDSATLVSLIAAVRDALPDVVPPPVPALDESLQGHPNLLEEWAAEVAASSVQVALQRASLEDALATLAEGIRALARGVSAAGSTATAAAPLVTEAQRDALRTATEVVLADLREGDDPVGSLLAWDSAAAALARAQAAIAASAATAASGSGAAGSDSSGGGHLGLPGRPPTDPSNPPILDLEGGYVGDTCPSGFGPYIGGGALLNGQAFSYSNPDPYQAYLYQDDFIWFLTINACT